MIRNRLVLGLILTAATACSTRLELGDPRADAGAGGWSSGSTEDGGSASTGPTAGVGGAGGFDVDGPQNGSWAWANPLPTGNDLFGVWGDSEDDVWVVGAESTVLRWNGSTWSHAYAGPNLGTFYDIWGSGADDVWVTGDGGVAHWNGTEWWTDYSINVFGPMRALWGSASNDVWMIAGAGLGVFRYDGATFEHFDFSGADVGEGEPVDIAGPLRALWGFSSSDVWAVGDEGTIVHFDGSTWSKCTSAAEGMDPFTSTPPYSVNYRGIWGRAPDDIWAFFSQLDQVGFSHWDGQAWKVVETESGLAWGFSQRGRSLAGLPDGRACAVGDGDWNWWCTDGNDWKKGLNMQGGYKPGINNLFGTAGVAAVSNDIMFTVGNAGGVARFDGASSVDPIWEFVTPGVRSLLIDASATTDGHAWAVTTDAELLRWEGETWVPSWEPGSGVPWVGSLWRFDAVWAPSNEEAWIAATGTDDGPWLARWTEDGWSDAYEVPGCIGITDLWGSGEDLWAVGYEGTILRRLDGSWVELAPPDAATNFHAVGGTGPSDVWILGSSPEGVRSVLHYDGASLTKVYEDIAEIWSPMSLWAGAPDEVWITGQPALRYDGSTWHVNPAQTDLGLAAVWGSGPGDVWLIDGNGNTGSRLRHFDGSSVTTSISTSPGRSLYSLTGSSAGHVWAVGDRGATLRFRYDDEVPR